MKIRNVNGLDRGFEALRNLDPHQDVLDKSVVFRKTLTDLSKEQHEAHLHTLIKEIDEQGARLGKRADVKELERYRRLIRGFIDDVVSNGYSFSKENTFESRGRHRFFATVKTIDEKLDALAKEVLKEQSDNIAIVHQIDDIRGLLLDMML